MEGMEFEGADDGRLQPAPVPPHERVWRHPSELGAHAWAASEPPLVLGRGLAAVTGTVALVLSGILAFTMLSTHPGRPTYATPTSAVPLGLSSPPTPATPLPSGTAAPVETASTATDTGTPGDEPTVPTFRVQPAAAAGAIAVAATVAVLPVAIPVGDGALIITTVAAVDDRREVQLVDATGTAATARVLFTDESSGLAVLLPDATTALIGIEVAESVNVGDTLEVPGRTTDPVEVSAVGRAPSDIPAQSRDVEAALDRLLSAAGEPVEGEPVVNQDGELVALCTSGPAGPMLVLADRIADLRRALGALLRPTVWLGVLIDELPSGGIVVAALDPDGPAQSAGIEVGDLITAVSGVSIRSAIELAGALAVRHVGDTVDLAVVHADGTASTVSVALAAPPPRL